MTTDVARSYLFVPGSRPERFERALGSGAHAVIVDLEDAVPPDQKVAARESLARWLAPSHPVMVRINPPGTEWHDGDLALCRLPGVAGIVVPKIETVDPVLEALCREGSRALLPLIETGAGFDNARAIAASPVVPRLLFGSIDFQVDLGIDGDGEELLHFRSQLVLVSRLAGLQPPADGVCTEIDDPEMLEADTERARRLGFGAKLCIHPRQVPLVNACFTPGPEEVLWARRVLAAATQSRGAAVALDGRMVDRPVILKAERIVREAERG